ncbi:MAG: transcription elongation factor GreA [Bacteroidales bacterium]|nr:transcription elongation factor GreA [Bacteroidales bacterium]
MEYLSKEGYDKIATELKTLIEVEYPKIKDALSEARAQGDLSENFEYRAARRAQAKMISRIKFLQKVLKYSRVIETKNLPKDEVTLLSQVEFTNLATGQHMAFQIVSPHEMNLQEGKISLKSPIGAALMGHKAGDEVVAEAPAGVIRLRIDKVTMS